MRHFSDTDTDSSNSIGTMFRMWSFTFSPSASVPIARSCPPHKHTASVKLYTTKQGKAMTSRCRSAFVDNTPSIWNIHLYSARRRLFVGHLWIHCEVWITNCSQSAPYKCYCQPSENSQKLTSSSWYQKQSTHVCNIWSKKTLSHAYKLKQKHNHYPHDNYCAYPTCSFKPAEPMGQTNFTPFAGLTFWNSLADELWTYSSDRFKAFTRY